MLLILLVIREKMMLEEATKEVFGYYPSELSQGSPKTILAACELCGEFKLTTKNGYRTFCRSCMWFLTELHKGKNNPCYGRTGENHPMFGRTGENHPMFGRTGEKCPNFGKKHTDETKAKISEKLKGKYIGEKNPFFGKTHTEKAKALMSEANKGENAPNWQGGISFEPYCVKFNKEFKDYIREKFGNKCFLCKKTTKANGKKLGVHHVNYNKNCGCDGDKTCQFVPLCMSCHAKTGNNREYWFKVITDKLHSTIIGWDV